MLTTVNTKSFLASRTIWVNVISAGLEVTGALGGVVAPGTLTLVVNGLNIALRLLTNQPLHGMPKDDENASGSGSGY